MNKHALLIVAAWVIGVSSAANSFDYIEQYGKLEFKASSYFEKPAYSEQNDNFGQVQIEPSIFIEQGSTQTFVQPRLRVGDIGASRADLKEAYISFKANEIDIRIGSILEFWGKTESYNPSDLINSYDYTSGLADSQKLGAPAFKLSSDLNDAYLSLFLIPFFVENSYPGLSSRQRLQTLISNDSASYLNNASINDNSYALRYEGYNGKLDYGLSYFDGITREPYFTQGSNDRLVPEYFGIQQVGVDVQYLLQDIALKTEMVRRTGQFNANGAIEDYNAGVFGAEQNIYSVFDGASDLILVGEMAVDSRGKDSHTIFQRDIAFGGTLLLNNMDNSEFNLFLIRDLSYTSLLTRFSYSTRLNDAFTIESNLNLYSNFEKDTSQAALAQDSNASITLSYSW